MSKVRAVGMVNGCGVKYNPTDRSGNGDECGSSGFIGFGGGAGGLDRSARSGSPAAR